jgi:hypothetical protein
MSKRLYQNDFVVDETWVFHSETYILVVGIVGSFMGLAHLFNKLYGV